jgi:hypothetical protein
MERIPKNENDLEKQEYPPIKLNFLYSGHEKSSEAMGFAHEIMKADIYITEAVGADESDRATLQKISDGVEPPIPSTDPFRNAELNILSFSKKPVLCVDIPRGHHLIEQFKKALEKEDKAATLFQNGSHKEGTDLFRESLIEHSAIQLEREQYIQSEIPKQVRQLLDKRPDIKEILSKKGFLDVTFSMGAGHTLMYSELKNSGADVKSSFSENPLIFDYYSEALRRIMRGMGVSDEVLVKALFERVIEINGIHIENIPRWRAYMKKFTIDEIEQLSKDLADGKITQDFFNKKVN